MQKYCMIHKNKKREGEKKYDRRENIYEKQERENIREENVMNERVLMDIFK